MRRQRILDSGVKWSILGHLLHRGKVAVKGVNVTNTAIHHWQRHSMQEFPQGTAMSNAPRSDAPATNAVAADAFLALSTVYLDSLERLSALNLNTAREAVDNCSAATRSLSEAMARQETQTRQSALGNSMWGTVLNYSRSMHQILATTNEEVSKVIVAHVSQPFVTSAGPAGWAAMADYFAKGAQQFAAHAAENVAFAAEARSKAAAASTPYPKRAA